MLSDKRLIKQVSMFSELIQPKAMQSPNMLLVKGVTKDFTSREVFIMVNNITFDIWELSITINNDNKATRASVALDFHVELPQLILLSSVMIDQLLSGYGERVKVIT
jgi:hypothetical protein